MDKTQKEKIREKFRNLDDGNFFDTGSDGNLYFHPDKVADWWLEQFDLAIKETEERIASSIRMAECSHDSNSHCMEEMCWIHQEGGYNEAVRDIINLIRNK